MGEALAISRTFKECLQKCLRALETRWPCAQPRGGLGSDGKPWRIGTEVYGDRDILSRDVIIRKLSVLNTEQIFFTVSHSLSSSPRRAKSGRRPSPT